MVMWQRRRDWRWRSWVSQSSERHLATIVSSIGICQVSMIAFIDRAIHQKGRRLLATIDAKLKKIPNAKTP